MTERGGIIVPVQLLSTVVLPGRVLPPAIRNPTYSKENTGIRVGGGPEEEEAGRGSPQEDGGPQEGLGGSVDTDAVGPAVVARRNSHMANKHRGTCPHSPRAAKGRCFLCRQETFKKWEERQKALGKKRGRSVDYTTHPLPIDGAIPVGRTRRCLGPRKYATDGTPLPDHEFYSSDPINNQICPRCRAEVERLERLRGRERRCRIVVSDKRFSAN
jgi:hypothetical protein